MKRWTAQLAPNEQFADSRSVLMRLKMADDFLEAQYEERYEGEDYNNWEEQQVFLDQEGKEVDEHVVTVDEFLGEMDENEYLYTLIVRIDDKRYVVTELRHNHHDKEIVMLAEDEVLD